MEEIRSEEMAPSSAPLSHAIRDGNTVYVSGQIPRTPDGEILTGDIAQQTNQVLENIETILEAAGTSIDNIIKATVFLTDVSEFDAFNDAYRNYLSEPYPARSAFEISALAVDGIGVEIEAIASI